MTQQVKQHYIAECYQRNFTDDTGKIWVLNDKDKIFPVNPLKIFKENHFYTVTLPFANGSLLVEKTLAQMEDDFSRVIRNKTEKRLKLNEEDRTALALFVSSLFIRTKKTRDSLKDFFNKIIKSADKIQNNKVIDSFAGAISTSGKIISLEELKNGMKDFDSWHSISTVNNMFSLAPEILRMNWIFLIAPKGSIFVSSDSPLQVVSPEREKKFGMNALGAMTGIRHIDAELTLPLSSSIALVASWKYPNIDYIEASAKQVEEINYRVIRATKTIFANNKKYLEYILEKDKQ